MAGETPEAWLGCEVLLHLWKSEGLGTESCTATLEGINAFGITIRIGQQGSLSFYPWSTLREISFDQEQHIG